MALQESGEMYLESLLLLSRQKPAVRSVDLSEHMRFSKPSVSRAVSRLKDDGYITVSQNGSLTFTEAGRQIAEKIYERHTVLTKLLTELGVEPYIAAEDACRIEHCISDDTFEAIKKHLLSR